MKKYNKIFISDIHLSSNDKSTLAKFNNFCDTYGLETKELYILGDLFEYWIGDNCIEPWHLEIAKKLKKLSKYNTKVYFMAGNRDFLISKKFAKLANITILKDPYIININNRKFILSHGDKFCTNDKSYQIYRKVAQNVVTKKILNFTPEFVKLKLADLLKRKHHNHKKPLSKLELAKYDTSKKSLAQTMTKYECLNIIHGHTHMPKIHNNKIKANNKFLFAKRYVLGDWQADKPIFLINTSSPASEQGELALTQLLFS